jgi:hypothetical protein
LQPVDRVIEALLFDQYPRGPIGHQRCGVTPLTQLQRQ